jgi:hypothetical protein
LSSNQNTKYFLLNQNIFVDLFRQEIDVNAISNAYQSCSFFSKVLINADLLFGKTSCSLIIPPKNMRFSCLSFAFSFSNDFEILFQFKKRKIEIYSNLTKTSHKSFNFNFFQSVFNCEVFSHFFDIVQQFKIRILYLEIQKMFSNQGYSSYVNENDISIVMKSNTLIILKICPTNYWTISIFKGQLPVFEKDSFVISGKILSSKFPEFVHKIVNSFLQYSTFSNQMLKSFSTLKKFFNMNNNVFQICFPAQKIIFEYGPFSHFNPDSTFH